MLWTSVKQELATEEEFTLKMYGKKSISKWRFYDNCYRIEELIAGYSIEDALKRAFACVKAGADGIMIHSKEKSGMDIKEFCEKFRKEYSNIPIVLVPTTYNQFTEKELNEWGANIIIYANHMLRASYPAMKKCAEKILECERSLEVNDICMPIKEILNLIPGTS